MADHTNHHGNAGVQQHHHILSDRMAVGAFVALIILTFLTVVTAKYVNLGVFNFPLALLIATTKAALVALIFMGLKYDRRENSVIFFTSFLFLAIFLVETGTDIFFRGDVSTGMARGQPSFPPIQGAVQGSKLKKPWISTPELVAHGKELFAQQCTSCHGVNGMGDGPAATALNPHPRNFHSSENWVNGRKPSMVFKTLKEGVAGSAMASFATLPADDRWALAHYVISLGPPPAPTDTPADLAKIGIDPTKENGGGGQEQKTVPVDFIIERMAVDAKH
jgi:caa(3)-type oxidase subunit IV